MTLEEQTERWAAGESIHLDGQCTPDFSCCEPELLAPVEIRQAYLAASIGERIQFLGHFLNAAFARETEQRAGGPGQVEQPTVVVSFELDPDGRLKRPS